MEETVCLRTFYYLLIASYTRQRRGRKAQRKSFLLSLDCFLGPRPFLPAATREPFLLSLDCFAARARALQGGAAGRFLLSLDCFLNPILKADAEAAKLLLSTIS